MNALADCAELIYNKLGLFKPERLTIIIDCYNHYLFIYKFTCLPIYLFTYLFIYLFIYFCHLRCLYNNIYKQTCQILNYLFNLNIFLPVFVSFVVLLEEFSYVPSWRIDNNFKCLYQIILVQVICHLGANYLILAFLFWLMLTLISTTNWGSVWNVWCQR